MSFGGGAGRRAYLKAMATKPLAQDDLRAVTELARPAFEALRGARVFITGGTGFFGHWLLESLLQADAEMGLDIEATVLTRDAVRFQRESPHVAEHAAVSIVEGDVRSFGIPAEAYTHVIHAATDSVPAANAPAYELPESIVEGTRHVLEFARRTGARRLLYVSSGAVYGRGITGLTRIAETYGGGPDPLLLTSGYDEAKRMAEQMCVAYSQDSGLECSVARCFAFVGPHLPLDGHFAIGNFIRDAMAGEAIRIQGDGTPLRSYMYMSDLAAWMWTMLVRGRANRAYNVGSDAAVSIAELARVVAATLRPGLEVRIAGRAVAGAAATTYVPDVSRAREELGLEVTVDLAAAIRRTAAWHGFVPASQARARAV